MNNCNYMHNRKDISTFLSKKISLGLVMLPEMHARTLKILKCFAHKFKVTLSWIKHHNLVAVKINVLESILSHVHFIIRKNAFIFY